MTDLYLYNSLSRKKEKFLPLKKGQVGMYICGPTVYLNAHIGHMRKYVSDDILTRTLKFFGNKTKVVMNITDVGHLTGDSDEGEDKMEKGARKTGRTVWEVAKYFEKQFFDSTTPLNIQRPDVVSRATQHIKQQVDLVRRLEEKGYTYKTEQGIYFDISKFKNYTKLSGQKLEDKKTSVRKEVQTDPGKLHPADFALWLFTKDRFKDHTMRWPSPWGEGFPGWHIECSAMAMEYLGDTLDIHTGGIDHIPVHHTNEIAQSQASTGKQFVRYWVHNNFLKIDGKKMSKSLGNLFTVEDVIKKGIDPLALRYLFLTAHYRDSLNFTWESLKASQTALNNLRAITADLKNNHSRTVLSQEKMQKVTAFSQNFEDALVDDLNMPQALAVVWKMIKSNIPGEDKYDLLMTFDEVLGLSLSTVSVPTQIKPPPKALEVLKARQAHRKAGEFEKADAARAKLAKMGYTIKDTSNGPNITKTP